jgi:hypothetical protein
MSNRKVVVLVGLLACGLATPASAANAQPKPAHIAKMVTWYLQQVLYRGVSPIHSQLNLAVSQSGSAFTVRPSSSDRTVRTLVPGFSGVVSPTGQVFITGKLPKGGEASAPSAPGRSGDRFLHFHGALGQIWVKQSVYPYGPGTAGLVHDAPGVGSGGGGVHSIHRPGTP